VSRIAVDAMGGDQAPREIVLGAIAAVRQFPDVEVFLVGVPDQIGPLLATEGVGGEQRLRVVPATGVVGMDERPVEAIRHKPDSSVARAVGMVAAGEADAVFSAGNTGAMVAACALGLRPLEGVKRPGIAVNLPTDQGTCTAIDMGANIQPRAVHLFQYAVMASTYVEVIKGVANPRVGLLNVGEEDGKGTDLVREAFRLLAESSMNFVGNVEAREIHRGVCDVLVCDGFVGNVVLKLIEGVGEKVFRMVIEAITRVCPESQQICTSTIRDIANQVDYAQYGGAPLLGVDGIAIIGHGRSHATAVANAIRVANEFSRYRLNELFVQRLAG
jgi:glycerol-3-phosphate acyltransferase PlsX